MPPKRSRFDDFGFEGGALAEDMLANGSLLTAGCAGAVGDCIPPKKSTLEVDGCCLCWAGGAAAAGHLGWRANGAHSTPRCGNLQCILQRCQRHDDNDVDIMYLLARVALPPDTCNSDVRLRFHGLFGRYTGRIQHCLEAKVSGSCSATAGSLLKANLSTWKVMSGSKGR